MKRAADLLIAHEKRSVEKARTELFATLTEIRHRLDPRVIAAETAENIAGRASQLVDSARTTVGEHKVASTGGVLAFVIAVALRIWISRKSGDRAVKPEDEPLVDEPTPPSDRRHDR